MCIPIPTPISTVSPPSTPSFLSPSSRSCHHSLSAAAPPPPPSAWAAARGHTRAESPSGSGSGCRPRKPNSSSKPALLVNDKFTRCAKGPSSRPPLPTSSALGSSSNVPPLNRPSSPSAPMSSSRSWPTAFRSLGRSTCGRKMMGLSCLRPLMACPLLDFSLRGLYTVSSPTAGLLMVVDSWKRGMDRKKKVGASIMGL
uniref:Uncharacterized protein n=1 Tax=Opuntia streptacantha TaxID=393608 RepID=A0A7C8ZBZ3_OPUST